MNIVPIRPGGRIDLTRSLRPFTGERDPIRTHILETAKRLQFVHKADGTPSEPFAPHYNYQNKLEAFWDLPSITLNMNSDQGICCPQLAEVYVIDINLPSKNGGSAFSVAGNNYDAIAEGFSVKWTGYENDLWPELSKHIKTPLAISGIFLNIFGTLNMRLRDSNVPSPRELVSSASLFGRIYNIGTVQYYW